MTLRTTIEITAGFPPEDKELNKSHRVCKLSLFNFGNTVVYNYRCDVNTGFERLKAVNQVQLYTRQQIN